MDQLYQQLKKYGKVKIKEPLSKHTTFKIGGPAKYFVVIDDTDRLIGLLKYLDGEGEKYYILGGGSNVLARDDSFDGVVINVQTSKFRIDEDIVEADAGVLLGILGQEAVEARLSGLEWGVGVPGTIAGAVYGNASAFGAGMESIVQRVKAYKDGEVLYFSNKECRFSYKESIFKREGGVILCVWFKLIALDEDEYKKIKKLTMERIEYRLKTQPKEKPSAGCAFKNLILSEKDKKRLLPRIKDERIIGLIKNYGKLPAGFLVEQVGMKGKKQGDAQVSDKHGNFIVNNGKAKATDVLGLIEEIKQKVSESWAVELEEEVQII